MLKKRSKVQQRLAKVVMAALLCTNAAQAVWMPSVAQAENIEVTSVTAGSPKPIIEATPYGSMASSNLSYGAYYIYPNIPYIPEVGDVTITGSSFPVIYQGVYDPLNFEQVVSGHKVTVSGANTVLGGVIGAYSDYYSENGGAVVSNNKVEIKDATIDATIDAPIDAFTELSKTNVIGGEAKKGDATNNTVEISGATIGSLDIYHSAQVIGGHSIGSYTPSESEAFAPKVMDNTVTVTGDGTKIYGDVIGGESEVATWYYASIATTVEKNTVNINGGEVQRAIGGVSDTSSPTRDDIIIPGTVNNNTVNITGGKVTGGFGPFYMANVAGGIALNGNATNNNVNISGGQVNGSPYAASGDAYAPGMIVGGQADNGEATGNQVTVSGGTLGGGETASPYPLVGAVLGDDTNNGETGGEETAEAPAIVVGGLSTHKANNNIVTISGGDIKDGVSIIGGLIKPNGEEEDTTSYEANNNTVNILTPINANYLFGGLILTGESGNAGSGNTLNIAAKNVTTNAVVGFQNMNFYLPKDIANKDTMLTIKGVEGWSAYDENGDPLEGATKEVYGNDLTGVKFGVAALKGVNLKKGDKVNLVVGEKGLKTDDQLKTTSSEELGKAEFLQQNSMTTEEKYELSIKKEGDNAIVTTVDNVKEEEKKDNGDTRKSPVETRMAVMTMINAGTDLLAGQGMVNAEAAAQEVKGGSSMFAAMSGGQLRAESGSHVTTKGLGLNLGFAKEIENKSGKLMFGPVLEYGHGKYDSYQDNGMTADGKASYWGLGFIAKQTNDNGFYYEGSVRVGRAKSDYGSESIVENSHISYDSSATYWAAHLGAGKVMDIGHNNTMDYYGKYFYSHTGGDSATIYRDGEEFDEVSFSGVNSNRFRVGARLTHAVNEKNNIYAGLAYQYEFSGTARATYRQGAAPSPGVKGSSGMIELGWQVKPGKKSQMAIDLGVTGWVGKQRGVTANLQANWTF